MDDLARRGRGRLVLRALAILGALGFLTLVMLQAMAFYAPPKPAVTRRKATPLEMMGETKAAPVIHPPHLGRRWTDAPSRPRRALLGETKAGVLGPLKVTPVEPAARE